MKGDYGAVKIQEGSKRRKNSFPDLIRPLSDISIHCSEHFGEKNISFQGSFNLTANNAVTRFCFQKNNCFFLLGKNSPQKEDWNSQMYLKGSQPLKLLSY